MATFYRVGADRSEVALELSKDVTFDPEAQRLALVVAGQGGRLEVTGVADNGWLRLDNPSNAIERLLLTDPGGLVQVWVLDAAERQCLHAEPALCHTSFFAPLVDFAAVAGPLAYTQPAQLAVFTHVHNDAQMLALWERIYLQWLPAEHVYVIDHGSSPPCGALASGVQVQRIPRGEVDHLNIAAFCNQFQRFLLTQYRWVLHVDVDEVVLAIDGFDALLARLDRSPPGTILRPGHAVDLLPRPGIDAALDRSALIGPQRPWAVPNPEYQKPVIVGAPATWGPGFHYVAETSRVVTDDRLWLVHLSRIDIELTLARNRNWRASKGSAADQALVDHRHRPTTRDAATAEHAALAASPGAFALPEALQRQF
jgi:hypothetical protein